MHLYRHLPTALVTGLLTLACAQPSLTQPSLTTDIAPTATTPTVEQNLQAQVTSVATSPIQSKQNTPDICLDRRVYDPDDTGVNLRNRPNGEIVMTLPNRTVVQLGGQARASGISEWTQVFAVDTKTWGSVWGDFLYWSRYRVNDPQDTSANVRDSPNGEVITAIANGTEVEFLGVEGNWTLIESLGGTTFRRGYIATSLLKPPLSCP